MFSLRKLRINALSFSIIAALCLIFSTADRVWASEEYVLKWDEVLQLVEAHPMVGAGNARLEAANAELLMARQYPNPELSAGVGRGSEIPGDKTAMVYSLELVVPVEWAILRGYHKDVARSGIEIARYEAEAMRLEILNQLRSLFVGIAHDEALLQSLQSSQGQLRELADIARIRIAKGVARPSELIRLEAELEKFNAEVEKARALAGIHREQLNLWLGGKLPDNFRVDIDLEDLPELPESAQAQAKIGPEHPLVKAALSGVRKAESAILVERSEAWPKLGLGAFYGRELDTDELGAIVNLTIPIFNKNRGGIARAKAEKQIAEHEAANLIVALKAEIIEVLGMAAQIRAAILKYRSVIIPKTETATAAVEKMYQTGETDLADALSARRSLNELRREYLALLLEYHLSYEKLTYLMGGK